MKVTDCALVVILIMAIGCARTQTKKDEANEAFVLSEAECFMYAQLQDTIRLQIMRSQEKVSGQLTYNLFEKDRNHGTINGTMKGDTLLADYTFLSEGVESVREVAFVKKGNIFMPLYGDVGEQKGKVIFNDPSALRLDESIILNSVPCEMP